MIDQWCRFINRPTKYIIPSFLLTPRARGAPHVSQYLFPVGMAFDVGAKSDRSKLLTYVFSSFFELTSFVPLSMATASPLSLAKPLLCALFLESILYGCYLITFASTARVLLYTRGKLKNIREVNTPVVIGTTGLFLIISGNAALCFYRSIRVFIPSPLSSQPGVNQILEKVNIIEVCGISGARSSKLSEAEAGD